MQRWPLAADDANRGAEVDLDMAGRVGQWNEGLPPPRPDPAHIVLHRRVAAGKAMLVAKPPPNSLRRMPLLDRRRLVGVQNRVDHPDQRPKLRQRNRLGPHVARRRRITAHL
jgi:hypothetical protein